MHNRALIPAGMLAALEATHRNRQDEFRQQVSP